MLDPQIVPEPVLTPGRCYRCGRHRGPMVDTQIEVPAGGRFYICVETCLPQFAHLAGYATPDEAADLVEEIDQRTTEIERLQGELELERDNKVVSLADIRTLMREPTVQEDETAKVGADT